MKSLLHLGEMNSKEGEVLTYRCFLNVAIDTGITIGSEIGYKEVYLSLPLQVVNTLKKRGNDCPWYIREPLQVSDIYYVSMPDEMIEFLNDQAERTCEDLEKLSIPYFSFNMMLLASSLSMNEDESPSQEKPLYIWNNVQLQEGNNVTGEGYRYPSPNKRPGMSSSFNCTSRGNIRSFSSIVGLSSEDTFDTEGVRISSDEKDTFSSFEVVDE